MKRMLAFLLAMVIGFTFVIPANAASDGAEITKEDVEVLRDRMTARGYGDEDLVADVLYDADEQPTYLIGISKGGYIILNKTTYAFHESGSGNPFADYMDARKYYGGPLQCFVKGSEVAGASPSQQNEFYHVHTGRYFSTIPTVIRNNEVIDDLHNNPLTQFKDAPEVTDWAYEGVLYCVYKDIMHGADVYFYPDNPMSRAMFVTTLYRLSDRPDVTYSNPYPDVSSREYYYNAVRWAAENGIVKGTNLGLFQPHENITREQLVVMMYRYAQHQECITSYSDDLTDYPDHSEVADYAREAMSWAVAAGLINGVVRDGVRSLAPDENVTREQAAAIIYRYNNYRIDDSFRH